MILRPLAALAALALFFPAAQAGPGDDLSAAIGRCASLADNSARLACYDQIGAQVKAGTPPGQLAAQTPPPATAPPASVPPAQVASQTPATPGREQQESWFGIATWFGGDRASPAAQATPQQFGSEYLPPPPAPLGAAPPPEPLQSIAATVADYAFNPFGRFTVFLDNGQIWQQLQADTDQARFSKNAKNRVVISRGAFGSYNLEIAGRNGMYKVKRIR